MKICTVLFWLIVLLGSGCQKGPYPYISLNDTKKIDSAVHPLIKNVAFIYQHNVYYASDLDQPVTQITKDGPAFKFVKMSHGHTKFAYLDAFNRITVIDNKGAIIATLSQYTQVKSFDWSADDKTLYILNGNAMAYYGPAINLPAITYPGIPNGSTLEVLSASVSMKGDLAYVIHGYNFLYGDKYKVIIKPAGNASVIEYADPDAGGALTMDYVNFSSNKQDLIVGYKEEHNGSDSQQRLNIFTDLKTYPDFSYGMGNYDIAATPVYNSSLIYLVGGFVDPDHREMVTPSALYLGPRSEYFRANLPQNKILSKFSFVGNSLYTDWK